MLFIWSLYALSGAGLIAPLPLLRPALFIITFIYLLRGVAGPFALRDTGRSQRFIVVSSLICLGFGLVHLLGMTQRWGRWRNALFLQDGNKRLRGGAAVSAFALQPHRLPHRHGVGQCHFFNCRFSRAMAAGSSVASCPRRTISTMAPSALASTATCGRNPSCVQ